MRQVGTGKASASEPLTTCRNKHTSEADQQAEQGQTTARIVPVLRYYRVFNVEQADHLPRRFCPEPGSLSEITEPQVALDAYLHHGGPQLRHVAGDRADYNWRTDTIRLPRPEQFRTPEGYYATAFHECGHSTGHPSRLARPASSASTTSAQSVTPRKNWSRR